MSVSKKLFSINKVNNALEKHPFAFSCGAAFVLNFLIEMLSRRSFFGGFEALIFHPLMFAYNSFIISLTLSVTVLFRRRIFVISLVSLFWLACGVTNCVLLSFRTTPFSAVDLQILSSVLGVINVYLNGFEMFLIAAAAIAAVILMTVLYIKTPRTKGQIHYVKACSIIGAAICTAFAINSISIAAESDSSNFPNIADAYEDYGFVYCFSNSILDMGIEEPENYSAAEMSAAAAEIGNDRGMHAPDVQPNIIMVQLESFFDVNHVKNLSFSENPVPNFTWLKENYSSGYLTVPSIGAGTANTEFEVLTGISLDFFGASEYPYKTALKNSPCESICYDLADYGYSSHAVHNNDGTFYDRHIVYPQLGFDSFTSIEYMQNVEYNPLGWSDDSALVPSITEALEATESRDFVFAVSVQPHGKYPTEMPEGSPEKIHISEKVPEMTDEQKTAFTYYVNQLYETDEFIGELISALENCGEPSVLVLYGDHLPNLELDETKLDNGSLVQTEYVMWSNYDLPIKDEDIAAYQLSAQVCEALGFGGGYVSSYNRNCRGDADYPSKMQDIGYDMLYGEQYAFGGYEATEMRMGVKDITVEYFSVKTNGNERSIYLYGNGFTEYSFVTLNGRKLETNFISSTVIAAHDAPQLENGDELAAGQAGGDGEILSFSNAAVIE